jgi:hypothetical protein
MVFQEHFARIDALFQHAGTGNNRLFFCVTWLRLAGHDSDLKDISIYGLLPTPHPLLLVVAIKELAPKPIPHFIPTHDAEEMADDIEASEDGIQWWLNPWNYSVM